MLQQFQQARRVSAPVVAIHTPDQIAAVETLSSVLEQGQPTPMLLVWDCVRGGRGITPASETLWAQFLRANNTDQTTTTNAPEFLLLALRLPEYAAIFMHNMHRFITNDFVAQAVYNVREAFKKNTRTLVLLGPSIPLPTELQSDVLVIEDPLPTEVQLEAVIREQCEGVGLAPPDSETMAKAVSATAGLARFPAEQVVVMSLRKAGIDLGLLWERKRQVIEAQPGLSVWRGDETFDAIGGIENVKQFGRSILSGQLPPRAVVFIDEIEKHIGSAGDTSGTSQEMLGTLLTDMQDKRSTGMLCVGPPGASKSMFAKALGNTGGIPTIAFDLSGMKGSLVGQSGANLRQALKIVDAVAQGRALYIATCNSMSNLPPELRRRFSFGTFYFDLPTTEEREVIWRLYLKKYFATAKKKFARPADDGWTGAEIRMCCDLAWRLNITLIEAAAYIVPVSVSARATIQKLREEASNSYISASYPGVYQYNPAATPMSPVSRRVTLTAEEV
jgi:hypothetical protein